MLEELQRFLRDSAEHPGQLIMRLWVLWWMWTRVRKLFTRKAPAASESPAQTEVAPAATPAKTMRERKKPRAAAARAKLARPKPVPHAMTTQGARWLKPLEAAQALRARTAADHGLRPLEAIVVAQVIEPLQTAYDHERRSSASHSARAHDKTGAQNEQNEQNEHAARALVTLQVLQRAFQERETEPDAAMLREVDAIALACQAPLTQYATAEDLALRGMRPLSVTFRADDALYAHGLTHELLLLHVPSDFGSDMDTYAEVLHELGTRWFFALPGLDRALRETLGLEPQVRLADPRVVYDERDVYRSFGPWLPALFADIALTLRLGSGYVSGLRRLVVSSPAHATRVRTQGIYLDDSPPPLLRFRAALATLAALGQHAAVEHHQAALAVALPDTSKTYVPLADGRQLVLPTTYLLNITDEITRELLEYRGPALGGAALAQWPGFAQTAAEAHAQTAAGESLARGRTQANLDAAQLLCAAFLATDAGADPALMLAALHDGISPRRTSTAARPEAQLSVHEDAATTVAAMLEPRALRAAVHNPRTLRNAIVFGAAFGRPRARQAARE